MKNKDYTAAVIAFLHKIYTYKKNITKYEINKIMSIQSKDFRVCQKSRDSTANHIFSRS